MTKLRLALGVVAVVAVGFVVGRLTASVRGAQAPQAAPPAECQPLPSAVTSSSGTDATVRSSVSATPTLATSRALETANRTGPAPAPTAPGEPGDGWQEVALDSEVGESLGSLTTRQGFSRGISSFSRTAFKDCFSGYSPPPGVDRYELELELRVVAQEKEFLIEDARPITASYGDETLERCILAIYKGRRLPVTPEATGRHRIRWPTLKYFD